MPEVVREVGRYEILSEVGRGGMATVYLARQTDLGRNVALKELSVFHAADPMVAQRFVRESRMAASLSHPNIVTVHDFFEEAGTPYIAMEYLNRGSLRPYIKRLTLPQTAGVLEGVLAGLARAETASIVHRDLKPENLLVDSDGGIKIADFGIAKAGRSMGEGPALTATGSTVGTPTYMAPEQAMAGDVGPWTDLYSVGVLAYEMLIGRVPFPEEDTPMAVLLHHINDPVPPLRALDPRIDSPLADWVEQLLVKDPTQRTQTAFEAWDTLEGIVIDAVGPRWRRKARLLSRADDADALDPLTPAPFESTHSTPTPSDALSQAPESASAPESVSPAQATSGFVTFQGQQKEQPAPPPPAPEPPVEEPPAEPSPPEPSPPEPAPPEPAPAAPATGSAVTVPPQAVPPPLAPVEESESPARPRARRKSKAGALVVGACVLAGAGAAFAVGQSGSGADAAPAQGAQGVAGDLVLSYPAGWKPVDDAPSDNLLPDGIAVGPPGKPAGRTLLAGITNATGPALLPDQLIAGLESPPGRPDPVRLGDLSALRYTGLRRRGSRTALNIYAAPTTAGVATLACTAPPADLAAFASDCERALATARLRDGEPLPLGPNADYADSLGGVLGTLGEVRRSARRRLGSARTARGQATAAAKLERALGEAARATGKLQPGPAEQPSHDAITAALRRTEIAYGRLSTAARKAKRGPYGAAVREVRSGEAKLQSAIGQLKGLGYAVE